MAARFPRSGGKEPVPHLFSDALLETTHPGPITVRLETFSTSAFKIRSLEYLLLHPRSALLSVPLGFAASQLPHEQHALLLASLSSACSMRPPRLGGELQRHPFSGTIDSMGELLQTPYRISIARNTAPLSSSIVSFYGVPCTRASAPYRASRFIPSCHGSLPAMAHKVLLHCSARDSLVVPRRPCRFAV